MNDNPGKWRPGIDANEPRDEDPSDPGPPHWVAPRQPEAIEGWEDDEDTQPTGVRRSAVEGPVGFEKVDPDLAVAKLNECLRGELSAVETYDLALAAVHDPELTAALRQIRDNHDRRVATLRDRIRLFGGVPSESSGAWGVFAKMIQRGADLLGDRAAMRALEEGEDHGLKKHSEDLDTFDVATREFAMTQLLPEQHKTHELCRSLQRFIKAA